MLKTLLAQLILLTIVSRSEEHSIMNDRTLGNTLIDDGGFKSQERHKSIEHIDVRVTAKNADPRTVMSFFVMNTVESRLA